MEERRGRQKGGAVGAGEDGAATEGLCRRGKERWLRSRSGVREVGLGLEKGRGTLNENFVSPRRGRAGLRKISFQISGGRVKSDRDPCFEVPYFRVIVEVWCGAGTEIHCPA